MGASSRSPSPITIVPCIGTVSIVLRMDSVAAWSLSGRSPWPMVRADSTAAFSTTRKNSSARSLSIFSPKFLACGSGRPSVGINTSCIKCDLGIYPLRSRDGSGGWWEVGGRLVWQARVARTLQSANCGQRDGLQGVHRFRVRSRPYAALAPHRMSPFRTSRCQGTLPTSRYGRAGGLRGACRFLSRLLPRQGCQGNGSRKSGAVEESRIHIAPSPWPLPWHSLSPNEGHQSSSQVRHDDGRVRS